MEDFLASSLGVLGAWFVVLIFFNIANFVSKNLFGLDFLKNKSEEEKR